MPMPIQVLVIQLIPYHHILSICLKKMVKRVDYDMGITVVELKRLSVHLYHI